MANMGIMLPPNRHFDLFIQKNKVEIAQVHEGTDLVYITQTHKIVLFQTYPRTYQPLKLAGSQYNVIYNLHGPHQVHQSQFIYLCV